MVGSMGNVCNDNDFKNQVPYAPILMLLNLIKKRLGVWVMFAMTIILRSRFLE